MPYLFQGQHSDEDVLLVCKQHPLVLLHPLLLAALILLVPFFLNIFMSFNLFFGVVLLTSLLVALVVGGVAWYAWVNSILILTNQRVILLWQRGLVHREFTECTLGSIQQVSHEVRGLLHTMFGYGDIMIYTGGSQKPFLVPHVPDPYDVQQEIQRAALG